MTPSIHDTAGTSTNCSDKLDKRYLQTIRCTANMGTSQYCDVMIVGVSRALSRVYQKSMDGVGAPTDGRPPQGASTGTQGGHHSGPNDTGHRQQRLLRLAGCVHAHQSTKRQRNAPHERAYNTRASSDRRFSPVARTKRRVRRLLPLPAVPAPNTPKPTVCRSRALAEGAPRLPQ